MCPTVITVSIHWLTTCFFPFPTSLLASGFQDNPWFCDCRISKLIEFSKIVDTSIVLLDPLVSCSGPENLAGILFQRAELEQCLKPSVMTSATKITSPLGSNVLLRCDATGYPTPQLTWNRSDNNPVNYTGITALLWEMGEPPIIGLLVLWDHCNE